MRLKTSPQSQKPSSPPRSRVVQDAVKTAIRLSKGDKSRKWEAVAPRAIPRWPSPKNGESRA